MRAHSLARSFVVLLAVVFTIVTTASCGKGGSSSSPTSPSTTPPVTTTPLVPAITLTSLSPACGSTVPRGVLVKIGVNLVADPGQYGIGTDFLDTNAYAIAYSGEGPLITGSGHYELTLTARPDHAPAISTVLVLSLHESNTTLASQRLDCQIVWQ